MGAYFEYLRQMLVAFFEDVGRWFYKLIVGPWTDVGNNFADYNSYFNHYSPDFGFWGWFFFVLFLLIFIALIAGLGYLIFIFARKYVRFVKKELDKDELRAQVERLNYELFQAIAEKDKILNLKTYLSKLDKWTQCSNF